MSRILRPIAVVLAILAAWQGLIVITGLPPFLLPGPTAVADALWRYRGELVSASVYTGTEILIGFGLGTGLGCALALAMSLSHRVGAALRPVMLVTQTMPVFALAPILTLWFGYGMAPKIVVTILITFFPVATAFLDGLMRVPPAYLDLAQVMSASPTRRLIHIRIPAALPALGTGIKLASVYAPVGAVIGEWVGGADGLGALMLHANGRMRIDLVFACLALVTLLTLGFHALMSWAVDRGFTRFRPL